MVDQQDQKVIRKIPPDEIVSLIENINETRLLSCPDEEVLEPGRRRDAVASPPLRREAGRAGGKERPRHRRHRILREGLRQKDSRDGAVPAGW